ncbi:hypothetical protein [Streptomyces sp. NPDC058045]|uniref:hypothetical protein n=1 Tax=Streptomyces sp. NPDC058045 TaxID=3346311 RepID=UPI0036EA58BF
MSPVTRLVIRVDLDAPATTARRFSATARLEARRLTDGNEQSAAGHWGSLARTLRRQGAEVDAEELARLPSEVVFGDRLRAWLS